MKASRVYLPITDFALLIMLQTEPRMYRSSIKKTQYKRLIKHGLIVHRGKHVYLTVQGQSAYNEMSQGDGHHFIPYPHELADEPKSDEPMEQPSLFPEDDAGRKALGGESDGR